MRSHRDACALVCLFWPIRRLFLSFSVKVFVRERSLAFIYIRNRDAYIKMYTKMCILLMLLYDAGWHHPAILKHITFIKYMIRMGKHIPVHPVQTAINIRFAVVIVSDLCPLINDGRTNCENLLPVPVAAHRLDHLRCGRHSAGHCHARGHVHRSRGVQDDFLRHFPVVGGEDHTGHQPVHDHSDLDSADCRRGEGNVDSRICFAFSNNISFESE